MILLFLVVILVSLLLSPGVKLLEKFLIPRILGSIILLVLLIAPIITLISQLQEPVAKWSEMLPQLSVEVSQKIKQFNDAIDTQTQAAQPVKDDSWFSWFKTEEVEPEEADNNLVESKIKESLLTVLSDLLLFAPLLVVQLATTIILILFTLVFSPKLFRQFVSIFVKKENQHSINAFALTAQQQLSQYILTISGINIFLGLASVGYLYFIGFEDALLLGSLIGLLNFIPYVGPSVALGLILVGSLVQWGVDTNTFIAVTGILVFNIIESQFINPMMLAKNMRINPLIIVVWLLICGWLWGLVGVIIAVPLAVCIKLILNQFECTKPWVKLIVT